jgi:hypothetical protein
MIKMSDKLYYLSLQVIRLKMGACDSQTYSKKDSKKSPGT